MNIEKQAVRVAVVSSIADLLGEPVESIGESDNLVDDLGLDSVSAAQLLVAIESKLSWRVPEGSERQLMDATRVGDLVEVVAGLASPTP
jgi:acyl carrier protein